MDIIEQALKVLEERLRYKTDVLSCPAAVKDFLRLRFADLEHEEFHILWLDAKNRLIEASAIFRGTLTECSVYPREVVKEGLRVNAACCIFAHNHPSGVAEPSEADKMLTRKLKEALALIEIRVLDHLVVGNLDVVSFAERGLIL